MTPTKPAPILWPVGHWRLASVVLSWFSFEISLMAISWDRGFAPAMLWGALSAVGLYLATQSRLVIIDMISQFTYRERFGALLVHGLVLILPSMFLGLKGMGHALGALGTLIAFTAVQPQHFGRLALVSAFLLFYGVASDPAPPGGYFLLWIAAQILAARALHIRFLLEHHDGEHGPDMRHEPRQMALTLAVPLIIGGLSYTLLSLVLEPKVIRVVPESGRERLPPMGRVSDTSVFFDAIILIGMIIGILVLLHWIRNKLTDLRKGIAEDPDPLGGRAKAVDAADSADTGLVEETATGARERTMLAFRKFARRIASLGVPRQEFETAPEFTARIASHSDRKSQAADASVTFDVACYSSEPMTPEQADEYEGFLDQEAALVERNLGPRATGNPPDEKFSKSTS